MTIDLSLSRSVRMTATQAMLRRMCRIAAFSASTTRGTQRAYSPRWSCWAIALPASILRRESLLNCYVPSRAKHNVA